jgi:hypothetical protein
MSKARDLSHLNELTDLDGISDGTNGQVLTTDGSGSFTFEDAAGGDLVDDTTPQLGGNLDANGNDIAIDDNNKIKFGADDDLEIYHNGTDGHSYIHHTKIRTVVGFPAPPETHLNIKGQIVNIQDENGDLGFSANADGTKLYDAGDLRLNTTGYGAMVHGELRVDGGIVRADGLDIDNNQYIYLGTNDTMYLTTTGSQSYLHTGDPLYVRSNSINLTNAEGNPYFYAVTGGAANIYHNGTAKLNTTSTGINVPGNIQISGTVDGRNVSVDGTKLDTIDTNADVTPSWVPSSDPSYLTGYTVTESDVTDHEAALSIATSQLTGDIDLTTQVTGTLPVSNMAATALTTVQTAADQTAHLALTTEEGDVVVRSDENKTYMHNGGVAGTMADYTLLATPTDSVTSVNGNTGVVTVTENVTTNLSTTANGTSLTVNSSDGTNASIPAATTSAWGAMTDEDKTKLDGIEALADVTPSWVPSSDPSYLTSYTVTQGDVTAHQAALSITESQISDLGSYITGYTVTQGDVTAHQAALSITESQISDLGSYLTSVPAQSFASLTGKPTTIAGYGITDALALGTTSTTALAGNTSLFSGSYADLTNKPTLLTLGTTSTTALAGDTTIPSALTDLSISDGTNGQVLTTNGSGSFTFEDAASPYGDTEVSAHLNTSTANSDEVLSWNGSDFEWVEKGATFNTFTYVATSNQTTFSGSDSNSQTLAYSAGKVIVALNGTILKETTDYTATNGTSVVLATGAEASHELTIMAFGTFDVANVDYADVNNTPTIPTNNNQLTNGAGYITSAPTPSKLSTATGSAPSYSARAWVNFNGTGSLSIRANGNVSSITDYGTGYYGVNFSTAMPDVNYAPVAMGKSTTSSYGQSFTTNTHQSHTQTLSQVRIVNSYQDDNSNAVSYIDSSYMFLAVYR